MWCCLQTSSKERHVVYAQAIEPCTIKNLSFNATHKIYREGEISVVLRRNDYMRKQLKFLVVFGHLMLHTRLTVV